MMLKFSIVLLLIWALMMIAHANILDNGVPHHTLGYADDFGYVLYTDKLLDLELVKTDVNEESAVIPIRIAFYTSSKNRKSILLNSYWSFSIFDSYLAKDEKNLIYWQTLDLNLLKFRPSKDKDTWETYGGYRKLKLLKNGDYLIEYDDSGTFDQLTYDRNGLIKKMGLA